MSEMVTFAMNDKYNLGSSSKKDIAHVKFRTQHLKNSFAYHSRLIWNALPEHVRSALTVNTFKLRCTKHYFEEQMKLLLIVLYLIYDVC